MAVDSRNKRASVLGFAFAAAVALPLPDTSVDREDRVLLSQEYAGLDLSSVSGSIQSDINAVSQSAIGQYGPRGTASNDINAIAQSATVAVEVTGTAISDINAISQSAEGSGGDVPDVAPAGGGWLPQKRKPRKPEWQKRDEERREFQEFLEQAYLEVTGQKPETPEEKEIVRAAVKTVAPYTPGKPRRPPPPSKVDFAALAKNLERAERLIELMDRKREEEEAIHTLLLM